MAGRGVAWKRVWLGARRSQVQILSSRQFFERRARNVGTLRYGVSVNQSPLQQRTWTDAQLTDAVRASSNWRAVMRELGLNEKSAGAIRIVRREAIRLGLDTSHFRGKRRWSDAQLRHAVSESRSWDEVLSALGLSSGAGMRTHVRSHAIRLGLDFRQLESGPATVSPRPLQPDLRHLREAGASVAATWFTLCGCSVLFPIEPATFDLVVHMPDGLSRVQVKTTTSRSRNGWQVGVGRRPYSIRKDTPLVSYDPDVIDYFFIIDGDLNMYLIPSRVIAGRVGLLLRAYKAYIVGNAGGLLGGMRADAVGAGA